MIQFCNSEVKLVVFCSVVMNVNELLDNVDWDKYFDVEVSKELFELEDVDLGENWDEIGELHMYVGLEVCVVFPRLIKQSQ